MRVNIGDHIGWNIFLRGYFDVVPSLVAMVLKDARPDAFYLDVGANIGDTSIAASMRGIQTIGIDASLIAIAELSHNVSLNSPVPYTLVHCAVAAASRTWTGNRQSDYLRIRVPMGNTGAASVTTNWNACKSSDVELMALPRTVTEIADSFGIDTVLLIKLDVEGAERAALLGMQPLLAKQHCPVLFEYIVNHRDATGFRLVDLLPTGYICYAISCEAGLESATLRLSSFDRDTTYENVLAVYESLPQSLQLAQSPAGLKVLVDRS